MMNCLKVVSYLLIVVCYFCGLFCNNLVAQGQTQWGKKTRCLSAPIMSTKVEKSIKKCQEEVKIELIEETLLLYNEYRQNLEAQLHAQAHVLHQTNEHQQEVPSHEQNFGGHLATSTLDDSANFHPDLYTTQDFEEEGDIQGEVNRKRSTGKLPTTPQMSRAVTRIRRDASTEWFHPTLISHEDKWIAGCLMQCIYRKNDAVDKNGWPTLDGLVSLYTEGVHEQGYFMNALRAVDICLKGASKKHKVNRNDVPTRGPLCDVSFDVFDCISDKITEYCSGHHNKQ